VPTTRTVAVRLTGDISDYNRALLTAATGTKAFVRELDSSNDRMLGPALVPIGAAFVPALSGLTNQLALSAGAAGVAVLAFQGIGDALKATNDYAIEPTDANLQTRCGSRCPSLGLPVASLLASCRRFVPNSKVCRTRRRRVYCPALRLASAT